MNGRHHHVGRAFFSELHDPFPEIGLRDRQSSGFQPPVQADLFSGHGFGFDDFSGTGFLSDLFNDAVSVFGRVRHMHMDAMGKGLCGKLP